MRAPAEPCFALVDQPVGTRPIGTEAGRDEAVDASARTARPWGDWGDDDELGRINLLTPEKVLQGVREVEAGISFCLSLPLDFPAAPP